MHTDKQNKLIANCCGWKDWTLDSDTRLHGMRFLDKKFNYHRRIVKWFHVPVYRGYKASENQHTIEIGDEQCIITDKELIERYDLSGYLIKDCVIRHTPPNYCGDLNLMHEVERTLKFPDDLEYDNCLKRVTNAYLGRGQCSTRRLWGATSEQRAEAYLKAMGLWEE